MAILHLLILGILGLVGGTFSGLAGVGGAMVFVPALVYVAGWEIKEAVAASLIVIVFTALSATLRNMRSPDSPNWQVAALLSSAVAPATLIGVFVSRVSSATLVEVAFATLLLALAYPTAKGPRYGGDFTRLHPALVLLAGVLVGALAGLLGIGGSVMMVPLMVLGLGLQIKTAISTSAVIALSVGIVGATGYVATGFEDLQSLPPLIVGSVIGAWLGVRLRDLTPDIVIRRGFPIIMIFIAVRMLVDASAALR